MDKKAKLQELEKRYQDLLARWPAHSVKPEMIIEKEELEDEIAELKKAISEEKMGHVFDPQSRHRLKNEKRKKILPPEETVAKLPLNPGEVILDYGAGIGYFTVPLAKRTGSSGVVYAVDISPEIIKDLEEEVLKEGLTNVKTALVPGDGSLPEEFPEFDVIFLATVLHELSEKEAVLSALTQKLKKQGKLIIIDWEKKETEFGPPVAHRVSVEEGVSYLEKAGLKLLQKMNVSAAHWGIIGIKE
ncbi:class I SAM-dependent methyltransferase [Carboxydothermus ferrireducens]|uniref:Ubiquinone/menaquinone biosynthesis C-methylase UbiE n=1 Tax=Carboxydothermus ferrireducens DSM 11255 TaxID=1119529 RepID=A0ABX2R5J3_9THEO|nr:methyltransferase domain-containing protein [Carboxydothermus ferrireducens]NYE56434.1 ubiquinone/menaquinone biosynthesis C-methylase UbiE [Carboxydothermus ferrireducens DSM 11255]